MGMRFLPIIQSFLVQSRFFYIAALKRPIVFDRVPYMTKIQNTKFSGHTWAWAWHVAHLAQRSKNFAKSFSYRWGISGN